MKKICVSMRHVIMLTPSPEMLGTELKCWGALSSGVIQNKTSPPAWCWRTCWAVAPPTGQTPHSDDAGKQTQGLTKATYLNPRQYEWICWWAGWSWCSCLLKLYQWGFTQIIRDLFWPVTAGPLLSLLGLALILCWFLGLIKIELNQLVMFQ